MNRPTVENYHTCFGNEDVVYIGRPSKWGNPFVIGLHGDRATVVELYRVWIRRQPDLMAALPALAGKRLVCYCAPQACHGDVLADLVEALPNA